jgi:hypothetical protein
MRRRRTFSSLMILQTYPFKDGATKATFEKYPVRSKTALLALRELIFETAAELPKVGELVETLKWGEPAYYPATLHF